MHMWVSFLEIFDIEDLSGVGVFVELRTMQYLYTYKVITLECSEVNVSIGSS